MTMMISAIEAECADGMAQAERRFIALAQHSIKVADADCLEGLAQAELRFQVKAKVAPHSTNVVSIQPVAKIAALPESKGLGVASAAI